MSQDRTPHDEGKGGDKGPFFLDPLLAHLSYKALESSGVACLTLEALEFARKVPYYLLTTRTGPAVYMRVVADRRTPGALTARVV